MVGFFAIMFVSTDGSVTLFGRSTQVCLSMKTCNFKTRWHEDRWFSPVSSYEYKTVESNILDFENKQEHTVSCQLLILTTGANYAEVWLNLCSLLQPQSSANAIHGMTCSNEKCGSPADFMGKVNEQSPFNQYFPIKTIHIG